MTTFPYLFVLITRQMLYTTTNIPTQILMIDYDLFARLN